MATLRTVNLSTYYGDVKAVDNINLDVRDAEFLVLLGASGSGKTTLMRSIAGLERPSSGEIYIGDQLANDLPPRARNIAMVFQSYALYPTKTVFKNISFPLEASKMDAEHIKSRVEWAAGLFGIGHLLQRKPHALSGGERQRVALARALVREPTLFLMDEPLSNLDAKLRHSARRELKRLHEDTGVTTVYVTHDQVEAMSLGHRVAVMNFGRIEQIGTPHELYYQPANTFVAQFMGSPPMNLVTCAGNTIGFHAEAFMPAALVPGEDTEKFTFHIQLVEDLGPETLLYGYVKEDECEGGPGEVIAKLATADIQGLVEEQDYGFGVERRLLHRFDAATGRRIG